MTRDNRQSELAKIHIAKKDLGLDDETYRSMLWTIARVTSAGELDHAGRQAVLDHLKSRGFKPSRNKVANFKVKLIWKIDQLLKDMDLNRAYADGIAKQMYKRDKIQWCDVGELRGIITALVKKRQRVEDKA